MTRNGAAEGLGFGGMNRLAGEKCLDGVLQVGRSDLRGDASVVAEGSAGIEQKRFGRPAGVEKIGNLAVAVLDVIEAMAVLAGVGPHLGGGLEIAGIDADEENAPLRELGPEVADQVVVV